jgi:hypothetical protein
MNKPIQKWDEQGKWRSEEFKLAQRVYIEISTRNIYERGGKINFAEFLNACFPMIEGLREALRQNACPVVATSPFASKVRVTIVTLLDLEDKWHFAYSQWLAAFKAKNPEVKKLLLNGDSFVYEDVQSFMRNGEKLYEDISDVIDFLNSVMTYSSDLMQTHAAKATEDRLSISNQPNDEPAPSWWQRLIGKK